MPVQIDSSGIILEDRRLPLYSGTVHYWRHPVESWKTILESVKKCGFDIITLDVPWGIHETGPSVFDFGSQQPAKNLDSFLNLCRERSLYVIIRPGPFHEGDIPCSGLPLWFAQNPSAAELTASGAPAVIDSFPFPHPIPSLASEKLYQEYDKYLGMLCPVILAPHQYPQGAVILLQGGGTQGFFRRFKAYDIGYSPDSLRLYRHYLAEKYPSIGELNQQYGTSFGSTAEILPPKGFGPPTFENLRRSMDWVSFKEFLIAESSSRLVALFRKQGMTVPIFQVADSITTPSQHHAVIEEDKPNYQALQLHPSVDRFRSYANEIRFACGTHHPAFAADFPQGAGCFSSSLSSPAEEEFFILSALMFGISAFDFRKLVECDGWTGSPVRRDGAIRDEYASVHQRLREFLTAYQVPESVKTCQALILANNSLERFRLAVSESDLAYLDLLQVPRLLLENAPRFNFSVDPYPESLLHSGSNWISDLCRFLESQQVEFDLSDTDAPLKVLNQYKLVFLPVCDFINQQDFDKFMDYVQRGGHLVMGPGQPSLDEHFRELHLAKAFLGQILYQYKKMATPGTETIDMGKITWQPNIPDLQPLISKEMQNKIQYSNPDLRLTIREGAHQLVYLCNPTDKQQTTNIISPFPLKGVWNVPGMAFSGIFQTVLNPVSVQVWEVIP
jgi:beta-galactosidase